MGAKAEVDDASSNGGFKFKYVVLLAGLLLFILALASHDPLDLSTLDGGTDEPLRNWIGPTGACTARALLYLFGLATYPIAALLIVCIGRSFMPFKLYRRGYLGSILAVVIGTTILMAMWPENFAPTTDKLGIGHRDAPELALSGGVIGSALAAPETKHLPAGLIRRAIGTVGTAIVALCFLLPGIVFIIIADWRSVISYVIETHGKVALSMAAEAIEAARGKGEQEGEEPESSEKPVKKDEKPSKGPVYDDEEGESHKIEPLAAEKAEEPKEIKPETPAKTAVLEEEPAPEAKKPSSDDDDYVPPPPPKKRHRENLAEEADVQTAPEPVHVVAEEPKHIKKDSAEEALAAAIGPVHVTNGMHGNEKPESVARKEPSPAHREVQTKDGSDYVLPPVALLDKTKDVKTEDQSHIDESQRVLQETLESFNIAGHVSGIVIGPRVTRFEVSLDPGVKVEKVEGIKQNIAMELKAESIRIQAPIPGQDAVGVEVPNKVSTNVFIRQIMEGASWKDSHADIPIVLGRDVAGKGIIADLAKAPHLLIAGSTGSGKSVCMNTLIMSLLFKFSPADLRLILVDPKHVELEMYRPLPHLITPVVNDPKKVPLALRWGVNEMEKRYKMLARAKAKNLSSFNARPPDPEPLFDEDGEAVPKRLPIMIIIIDELADIMMTDAKADVETSICRIAQKGRAAGIHLVIATQTPRKDIVTGLIKANLPTKIAFKVTSGVDSRVILDVNGAESLLGKGDMLFRPPGGDALERVQGAMVSDPEIQKVVDFVSGQVEQSFDHRVVEEPPEEGEEEEMEETVDMKHADSQLANSVASKYLQPGDGELVRKAVEIIITENKASTSYLQRRLGIGYNKSAEIMDLLEHRGIVSAPLPGGQKREILVTDHLETNPNG